MIAIDSGDDDIILASQGGANVMDAKPNEHIGLDNNDQMPAAEDKNINKEAQKGGQIDYSQENVESRNHARS